MKLFNDIAELATIDKQILEERFETNQQMAANSELNKLKAEFDEQVDKIGKLEKERANYLINRRQLESQLTENKMVKDEFERLESDTGVFKLVGPVLVKQDLNEAKEVINKRIEYIGTQM